MDRNGWNKRYADKEFVWSADPNQFLVAETGNLSAGRALDLGTGEGRNAIWLAQHGWRVTAVDFSTVGLAKARRLARAQGVDVEWVLSDVSRYRPRSSFYDLVLLCYLHLPAAERHRTIALAREAVGENGTFLYIGHDLSNIEHGHGGPQDPAVLCTPQDVVADLSGLQIIKAEVVRREVSLEPTHGGPLHATALDTLVRAVRPLTVRQQR